MKKMMMVLMMAFTMMTGLFAYEPKKECAKVKRNGDVKYYEKTELYNWLSPGLTADPNDTGLFGYSRNNVSWVIRKGYTVEQFVDYGYEKLELARRDYYYDMEKVNNPKEPSNASKAYVDAINAINGTNITPEEHEMEMALESVEEDITWATTCIVFVTEENFLTLTKEEMLAKMYAFIEDVKATK